MASLLKPYIQGHVVHDLGCGEDLRHAALLLELEASKVVAIDKDPVLQTPPPGIEFRQQHFHEVPDDIDVAWVSWPVNWVTGLHSLVERAQTVVYFGKNTDGIMCGEGRLWGTLVLRPILLHVSTQKETLIVYSSGYVNRGLLPEEYAALHIDTLWGYQEVIDLCGGTHGHHPRSTDSEEPSTRAK